MRVDHADAKAGEALSGVVGRDGGDDAMNVIVNLAIVDLGLDDVDAEVDRISHRLRALACREQRLGGDTAIVQAIAAHLALLDEDDGHAKLRRSRGHGEAARARADDAEIGFQHLFHYDLPLSDLLPKTRGGAV